VGFIIRLNKVIAQDPYIRVSTRDARDTWIIELQQDQAPKTVMGFELDRNNCCLQ